VNRTLAKNIFSLTTAELISKTLTFLYTAYLARIILTEGVGSISLGQYFAGFFLILNAGLDTYSIRLTAANRERISDTFNELFSARIILSVISYLLLLLSVVLIDKPDNVKVIILVVGLSVIAQINYINWLYMAIERFEIIAVRLVVTSVLNFIGIIVFVKGVDDILTAAIIIASTQILNALWMALYYNRKINKIKLKLSISTFYYHIRSSIPINLTFMLILFYNSIGMILVGLMIQTNFLYQNGILGAAIKLQLIAVIPMSILQQSFFPQLARADTKDEKSSILDKFTGIMFLAAAYISVAVFFYSDSMIALAFGQSFAESAAILKILCVAILLMFVNTTYSIPLIAWGNEKKMVMVFATGAITSLIFNLIMIPFWGMYATAIGTALTEFVILIFLMFLIFRSGVNTFFHRLPLILLTVVVSFALPFYFLYIHFIPKLIISSLISAGLLMITKQVDAKSYLKIFQKH
jgi:O-antigen/teichoic acid export membrane protein